MVLDINDLTSFINQTENDEIGGSLHNVNVFLMGLFSGTVFPQSMEKD